MTEQEQKMATDPMTEQEQKMATEALILAAHKVSSMEHVSADALNELADALQNEADAIEEKLLDDGHPLQPRMERLTGVLQHFLIELTAFLPANMDADSSTRH